MAETKDQANQATMEDTPAPAAGGASPEETGGEDGGGTVSKAAFSELAPSTAEGTKKNLDLLMDVTVPLTVELGHSTMRIEEVLKLTPGAVVELDKRADEPIDVKVNGKLIARGEIVVVEDSFGIRISEIIPPDDDRS